jgi:ribosome-associated protein
MGSNVMEKSVGREGKSELSEGSETRIALHMADDHNVLVINPEFHLPLAELEYRASRSGGPGGQHVNTSSTRVEVSWDLAGSPSLSPEQRARLLERLASRLDSGGRLRLVSSGTRSQLRNKEDVTERLRTVVAGALVARKKRKATKPSRAAKAARLEAKRRRAAVKRYRKAPRDSDG